MKISRPKIPKKRKPIKVWKQSTADSKFSVFIRERDKKCLRCGSTNNLQCSHYWNRSHYSTRYDPENCITLCYPCHYGNSKGWEYDQQGEYRYFMIKRLGKKKYDILEKKHYKFKSRRDAILEVMGLLKQL